MILARMLEREGSAGPARILHTLLSAAVLTWVFCDHLNASELKGDPARALPIVQQTCSACHGSDGNSPNGAIPSLAGQFPEYLLKQLTQLDPDARHVVDFQAYAVGVKAFPDYPVGKIRSWPKSSSLSVWRICRTSRFISRANQLNLHPFVTVDVSIAVKACISLETQLTICRHALLAIARTVRAFAPIFHV